MLITIVGLFGCANKDWYIHAQGHAHMDYDITLGRGKASTVQKVATEDTAE